jgi:hypothetical protein
MAAAARWAEAGAISSAAAVKQETADLKNRLAVLTNALDWLCPRVRPRQQYRDRRRICSAVS